MSNWRNRVLKNRKKLIEDLEQNLKFKIDTMEERGAENAKMESEVKEKTEDKGKLTGKKREGRE